MQLVELDACTQCGECLKYCPVQEVTGRTSISPPEKIRMFREFIKASSGLKARLFGGKGGAARKVFHDNAVAMGRLSIDEAVEKNADRLILSCPACYAKVNEAMEGYDKQIRITDIMELLAELIQH